MINITKNNIPNPTIITYNDKNGKTQKSNIRVGTIYKKTSITIHSTGNEKSTAENERNWLVNPTNSRVASWNLAVDEDSIVEAIPENEISYHAGKGSGNTGSIGIEICESGDRLKTLNNAVDLVVYLLKKHNLKITDIKKHYDWTKKNCPRILIDKTQVKDGLDWNWFIKQIELKLKPEPIKPVVQIIPNKPDWKEEIILKSLENNIITDNGWLAKKDEAMPVWAVLSIANKLKEEIEKLKK